MCTVIVLLKAWNEVNTCLKNSNNVSIGIHSSKVLVKLYSPRDLKIHYLEAKGEYLRQLYNSSTKTAKAAEGRARTKEAFSLS